MKTLFKWLLRLVAAVVVLAVALVLCRNVLFRQLLVWQIHAQTGFDARIGYLHADLTSPTLRLEDVKVYYPASLGGVTLLELPELYLEYDRSALWRRHVHIPSARLAIREVNVVLGHFGLPLPSSPPTAGGSVTALAGRGLVFDGIDRMDFSLGRVNFLTAGANAPTSSHEVNLEHKALRNLKTPADFGWQLMPVLLAKGLLPQPAGSR